MKKCSTARLHISAFSSAKAEREADALGITESKKYLLDLAARIADGYRPSPDDGFWLVIPRALRAMADTLAPRKQRGRPPKIHDDTYAAAVHLLRETETYESAIEKVAVLSGCSVHAIRKAYDSRVDLLERSWPAPGSPVTAENIFGSMLRRAASRFIAGNN